MLFTCSQRPEACAVIESSSSEMNFKRESRCEIYVYLQLFHRKLWNVVINRTRKMCILYNVALYILVVLCWTQIAGYVLFCITDDEFRILVTYKTAKEISALLHKVSCCWPCWNLRFLVVLCPLAIDLKLAAAADGWDSAHCNLWDLGCKNLSQWCSLNFFSSCSAWWPLKTSEELSKKCNVEETGGNHRG